MKDLYEYIEAYHKDRLTAEEKEIFEREMAKDADLQEAVQAYPNLEPVLDYLYEEDIRTSLKQIVQQNPSSAPDGKIREIRSALLVAASVLILVVAGFWILKSAGPSSGPELYAEYKKDFTVSTTRGAGDQVSKNDSLKMAAQSFLQSGLVAEAEATIGKVDLRNDVFIQDEVDYFLVMVALLADDLELAKERATAMLAHDIPDNYQEALESLLRRIE